MPSIAEKEARIIISKYGKKAISEGFRDRDEKIEKLLLHVGGSLHWNKDHKKCGETWLIWEGYDLVKSLPDR